MTENKKDFSKGIGSEEFTKHACMKIIELSNTESWDDFSEKVKVQMGFNMGAVSLSLDLAKENGFLNLESVRKGDITMDEFKNRMIDIFTFYNIELE